jgi:DNA polymerase III gamma/tau subunit
MPGELRVDTAPLAPGGQGLLSAAGDIPLPPVPFTATGADALSTILNARTQAIEAPLIAGMPVTKAEALRTAQNIIQAAAKYEVVDQNLADQVLKALSALEGAEVTGAGGSGTAGTPATAATAGATPAAGAAQQAGQMGQMMGMPMQMAQQAAQIPMQLAGMAASIPQGIMQGVQSAMQQVGQMAGGTGEEPDPELNQQGEGSPDEAKHAESAEEKPATPSEGAAGPSNAERAPATGPQPTPSPDVPQQPHRPAPTRPATSGPESVL